MTPLSSARFNEDTDRLRFQRDGRRIALTVFPTTPKPRGVPPFVRGAELVAMLYAGGTVTTQYVRKTYGVSRATAKRDINALQDLLVLKCARDGIRKTLYGPIERRAM